MAREDTATLPATRPTSGFTDQLIEPLTRLRSEVDRLFQDFPYRMPAFQFGRLAGAMPFPAVQMSETDKAYKLSVEIPGMDPKDVDVTVADGMLVIKGEKKEEREEKEKDYLYSERSFGSFERRIELPAAADPEKIKAKSKDGVLQITIGKNAKAEQNKRRIEIQS